MIRKVLLGRYIACLEAVWMEGVSDEAYCMCRRSVMGETTMEMAVAAFQAQFSENG